MSAGWIGVDLDGTLAVYDGWRGVDHIGEPIAPMVERIKGWLSEGRLVKIFTARVCVLPGEDEYSQAAANAELARTNIRAWCREHIGCELEVTNVKDYAMIELWDDRAVQVHANTGIRADGRAE